MKRNNLTTSVVAGLAAVAGMARTAGGLDIGPRASWGAETFPTHGKSRNKPDKRKQRKRK